MAVQVLINAANANADKFAYTLTPQGAFTIDCKLGSITGSPTWTLLVSNTGTTEAEFKEYSIETTNMAVTTGIESAKLNFEFIAVKFNSNSSTGTYSFNIGK